MHSTRKRALELFERASELADGAERLARGTRCCRAHHSHALHLAIGHLRCHENWIWIHVGEGRPCCHYRWERGGGLLPLPPLRRKKRNHSRIHRRGGSAAEGEGEGVLLLGEEWPPRGKAPRAPSGWGMAYRHRHDGMRPLDLNRVRWREPYPSIWIIEATR
jgi:hypothetical protein